MLFGGTNGRALGDLCAWDGRTWRQLPIKGGPSARAPAGTVYDAARKQIVLYGGTPDPNAGRPSYLNDTWTWDGRSWTKR
jgi:hypothetical protein